MNDNWGKIRQRKDGKMDQRTKIAKAFIQQGEKIDKKDRIVYDTPKEKVSR